MNDHDIPNISLELLDYLEKTFPNVLPSEDLPSFDLGKLVGIQNLIDHLIVLRKSK